GGGGRNRKRSRDDPLDLTGLQIAGVGVGVLVGELLGPSAQRRGSGSQVGARLPVVGGETDAHQSESGGESGGDGRNRASSRAGSAAGDPFEDFAQRQLEE